MESAVTQVEIEAAVAEVLADVEPEIEASLVGKGKWAVIGFRVLWPLLSVVLANVLSGYISKAVGAHPAA